MTTYKVEVTFAGSKTAFLIWYMDAETITFLVEDVVKKLRAWLGADSMFLQRVNEYRYSMKLVTVELGTVEISVVIPDDDDS